MQIFKNRHEAGLLLARKLTKYSRRADTMIFTLPTESVSIGVEVARSLKLPLFVFLMQSDNGSTNGDSQKNTIAISGVQIIKDDLIKFTKPVNPVYEHLENNKKKPNDNQTNNALDYQCLAEIQKQTILFLDDGSAPAPVLQSALTALRELNPAYLVAGIPIMCPSIREHFENSANEAVFISTLKSSYDTDILYDIPS